MALDQPRAEPLQSGDELREEFRIARYRRMTGSGVCASPAPPGRVDDLPAPAVGITGPGGLPS